MVFVLRCLRALVHLDANAVQPCRISSVLKLAVRELMPVHHRDRHVGFLFRLAEACWKSRQPVGISALGSSGARPLNMAIAVLIYDLFRVFCLLLMSFVWPDQ